MGVGAAQSGGRHEALVEVPVALNTGAPFSPYKWAEPYYGPHGLGIKISFEPHLAPQKEQVLFLGRMEKGWGGNKCLVTKGCNIPAN